MSSTAEPVVLTAPPGGSGGAVPISGATTSASSSSIPPSGNNNTQTPNSGGASSTPTALADFVHFPPFYTLQPNPRSQAKQLQLWSDHLREHADRGIRVQMAGGARSRGGSFGGATTSVSPCLLSLQTSAIFRTPAPEEGAESGAARRLKRKASPELFDAIAEWMAERGYAEKTAKSSSTLLVYPISKTELAELIYGYASRTGKELETLFNLMGDADDEGGGACAAKKEYFQFLPRECVVEALRILEREKKVELFGDDEEEEDEEGGKITGVKFFL